VTVVRLDETTFFNGDPNDWWKEEWFFYYSASLGWTPMVTKGKRKRIGDPTIEHLWELRLVDIQDLQ
jgi:hypothetical protein